MINSLFDAIVYYLPVFVPLALAVFSVITRVVTGTMVLTLRNFLKTYTDIVLGIFSFLIWALITFMQTDQIGLNPDLVISFPKLIILLIIDIIWLVIAAVVSRLPWERSGTYPFWTEATKERFADTLMVFITLFLFVLPIFLTSPAKASQPRVAITRFKVVVPYEDPSIPRQVGAGRWASRRLCETALVEAQNEQQAKELGKTKFRESGRSPALFSRKAEPEQAAIIENFVLAQAEGK